MNDKTRVSPTFHFKNDSFTKLKIFNGQLMLKTEYPNPFSAYWGKTVVNFFGNTKAKASEPYCMKSNVDER